ncbi:MAG: hypothetical protein EA383_08710 [Spirochaetaceae bacterium]|nr:MAG: hypothetical protein EA383_08710 [Spirochaetaceae bacterium]
MVLFKRQSGLQRSIRYSRRFQDLVSVLARYGLADLLKLIKVDRSFRRVRRLLKKVHIDVPPETSRWERLRLALEELGPTFIKFGQLLSNRNDILPAELIRELESLQDRVPPFPVEDVHRTIQRDLGRPVQDVFKSFDDVAVASASIAQVHKAQLHDGTVVAVKVQRPGLRDLVDTDLDILMGLARLVEAYVRSSRLLNPTGFVQEFRERLFEELDFSLEAQSIRRFTVMFAKSKDVRVPVVYRDLCSERIVTMEYIEGTRMTEVIRSHDGRFDKKELARKGANIMLEQVYLHGFFHGDPHPGNLMVLPGNVICFLDFGAMGRLRPRERQALNETVLGLVDMDTVRVTDALLDLTEGDPALNRARLEDAVFDLIDEYSSASLEDLDLGTLFQQLVGLAVSFGLRVPTRLLVMIKATITIEGVGRNLDPEFQPIELLKTFARRIVLERLRPERLAKDAATTGLDLIETLRTLPRDAQDLIGKARSGKLSLGFKVEGLDPLMHTLDAISFRLVFGIVLAALMIASALITQAGLPPTWNDLSVIGLGGFLVSGLLGMGFVFSLLSRVFRRH